MLYFDLRVIVRTNHAMTPVRDDQAIDSFCIITTKPHPVLSDIHHRSPVILNDQEKQHQWLSQPYSISKHLLGVYDGVLTKHPVEKTVNYSRNKGADLIARKQMNDQT